MVSSKENLPEQAIPITQSEIDRRRAERLIVRHINPGEHHSLSEARIGKQGPPVWRIVGFYQGVDGDIAKVKDQFRISGEVVEAALFYYDRFKELIDARILLSGDRPLSPEEFRKLFSSPL